MGGGVGACSGQTVPDLTRTLLANLGWDDVRLPAPLLERDTLWSGSEVLAIRESRSRPGRAPARTASALRVTCSAAGTRSGG